MRLLRASNAHSIEIAAQDEINSGGEARIYFVATDAGLVAKVYRQPKKEYARKLRVMLDNPPSDPTAAQGHASIAWPVDLLRADNAESAIVGYLMPRVAGAHPVIDLYNPISRRETSPLFSYQYLYRTAHNMAAVMQALHNRDYVVGDVNESNILVTDTALITIVDTDSFQVRDPNSDIIFHCPVAKPEFTPPELQGKLLHYVERTPAHDRFGLAVLIFQLLMEGTHPFAGIYTGDSDPPPYEDRIAAGHFPHGSIETPYRPLPFAPPLAILPASIHYLFMRCFQDGHESPQARPDAAAWVKALRAAEQDLIACETNDQHRYGKHLETCPWCERTALLKGRDPFPAKERVLSGRHLEPIDVSVQTPLPSVATPRQEAAAAAPPVEAPRAPATSEPQITPPTPATPSAPPTSRITFVGQSKPVKVKQPFHVRYRVTAILLIVGVVTLFIVRSRIPVKTEQTGTQDVPIAVEQPPTESEKQELFRTAQRAVTDGSDSNLQLLLEKSPQIARRQGKDGWTLLHFAAYKGRDEAVQLLVKAGAEVGAKEKDGFAPLHLAAQEGKIDATRALVDAHADLNAQENVGWTPLHFAAQEGRLEVAALLLDHGANPNIKDNNGLTSLAVATHEKKPKLAEVIKQHGGTN